MKDTDVSKGRLGFRNLSLIVLLALLIGILQLSVAYATSAQNSVNEVNLHKTASKSAHSSSLRMSSDGANGQFVVWVLQNGSWKEAGKLPFDHNFKQNTLDIGAFVKSATAAKVRIEQEGGAAAHLDSVFLGDKSAVKVNGKSGFVVKKLSKTDFDVINLGKDGIELVFHANTKDKTLAVTGRIEGETISKTPFQYPLSNLYETIDANSSFYMYDLGSNKVKEGKNNIIKSLAAKEPLFKVFSKPDTGHPNGFTYGWVGNDSKNLYVLMDFTPDNTFDGDKDYAKVYVKTDSGVKEFKVSVPDQTWGKPYFIYTDKVKYQHKVYSFTIPLDQLGTDSENLSLAFAAYGTAAVVCKQPAMAFAYNSETEQFLVAYARSSSENYATDDNDTNQIVARSVSPDGLTESFEEEVYEASGATLSNPAVASGYAGTALVVWDNAWDGINVQGQLVERDGEPAGGSGPVSFADWQNNTNPAVAYDGFNEKYLVVWDGGYNGDSTGRNIYGRIIDKYGALVPGEGRFQICTDTANQENPVI
ncbi:MAG: hypothetical protein ACYC56_12715, partial [Candidatus Aquicultor sp.]